MTSPLRKPVQLGKKRGANLVAALPGCGGGLMAGGGVGELGTHTALRPYLVWECVWLYVVRE